MDNPVEMFSFRVEGVYEQRTALPTHSHKFDETYELEGEHPAHAAEKLLHEIEWGVLDSYNEWTITFVPTEIAAMQEP